MINSVPQGAGSRKPIPECSVSQGPTPSVRWITIDGEEAGQRLDNYLSRLLKGVPKTRVYRIIRKGEVRVNKKRVTADYRLQAADTLRIPPVRVTEKEATRAPVSVMDKLADTVLYEDARLLIINKPAGLAVHGGSGINCGVIEALRQMRPHEKHLELVHRLDRDTSGCLMIAKRRSMLCHLHGQLQQREGVQKLYHALVAGRWPARRLMVKSPLQKNTLRSGERMVRVHPEGKTSRTRYRVLERLRNATLVEASPLTGRTHQIRVHCQDAGHAILGDTKYGSDANNTVLQQAGLRRLFLHASSLGLTLADGKTLNIEAPLPDDLQKVLKNLNND
ncbi:23S rRNA pseudouridine(955/2504/2580) synthase RluC [Candidatus Sororendozoicomonas aggregata]|uniref:23S rRNA pseudouridine(955/2504/2580) synthase RluC n=1 Tax=Candidatus Sororendozoicomonas aggregata TaxID=3073239 RepID=UPI002ED1F21D